MVIQEQKIGAYTYRFKLLGARTGFSLQTRLLKMISSLSKSGSKALLKTQLKKVLSSFLAGSLRIDEKKLKACIGTDEWKKLRHLLGRSHSAAELSKELKKNISNPDLVIRILTEAEPSNPLDFFDQPETLSRAAPELFEMINDVVQEISEEQWVDFFSDMLVNSLVSVDFGQGFEEAGEGNQVIKRLDEMLAGKWNELLELVVFLCLKNFVEPIKALKKSQIFQQINQFFLEKKERELEKPAA